MGLLGNWTWGKPARLIADALASARVTTGPVLVLGPPGLARVLAERGLDARATAEGALAALVVVRAPLPDLSAVQPGGAVVLLGGLPATEESRRALCAGLVDLEQRRAGRLVVTSGRTR